MLIQVPELEPHCQPHCRSWIIVYKTTGEVSYKTFYKEVVLLFNPANYVALTALQWQDALNRAIALTAAT